MKFSPEEVAIALNIAAQQDANEYPDDKVRALIYKAKSHTERRGDEIYLRAFRISRR